MVVLRECVGGRFEGVYVIVARGIGGQFEGVCRW